MDVKNILNNLKNLGEINQTVKNQSAMIEKQSITIQKKETEIQKNRVKMMKSRTTSGKYGSWESQPTTKGKERVGLSSAYNMLSSQYSVYTRPDAILTNSQLRRVAKQCSTVRPCINDIVKEISTFRWKIIPKKKEDAGKPDIIAQQEKATKFFSNPNINNESFQQLKAKLLTDVLTYDAGVWEKVKNLKGDLLELFARDGSTFKPMETKNGVITSYEQFVAGKGQVDFKPNEIIYMMLFPRSDSVFGTPIIESIVEEVISLLSVNNFIAKSFTEDEIPEGVLDLGPIGEESYERAKEDFEMAEGRISKQKLHVVTSGKVNWIEFKRSNAELQMYELKTQIENVVYRNFGLMPFEMGADTGKGAAREQGKISRSRLTEPITTILDYFINMEIVPDLGCPDVMMKTIIPLADDREKIARSNTRYINRGVKTINQAREEIDMEPYEVSAANRPFIILGAGLYFLDELEHSVIPNNEQAMVKGAAEIKKTEEIQKKDDVLCESCKEVFDMTEAPEVGMGEVECPSCQSILNQEGQVVQAKTVPEEAEVVEKAKTETTSYPNTIDMELMSQLEKRYLDELMLVWNKYRTKLSSMGINTPLEELDTEFINFGNELTGLANKEYQYAAIIGQESTKQIMQKGLKITGNQLDDIITNHLEWNSEYINNHLLKDLKNRIITSAENINKAVAKGAEDFIEQAFDAEKWRVPAYTGGCVSVANGVLNEEISQANEEIIVYWKTTSGSPCPTCKKYELASPFKAGTLPAKPGDGSTDCASFCHCQLVVWRTGDPPLPGTVTEIPQGMLPTGKLITKQAIVGKGAIEESKYTMLSDEELDKMIDEKFKGFPDDIMKFIKHKFKDPLFREAYGTKEMSQYFTTAKRIKATSGSSWKINTRIMELGRMRLGTLAHEYGHAHSYATKMFDDATGVISNKKVLALYKTRMEKFKSILVEMKEGASTTRKRILTTAINIIEKNEALHGLQRTSNVKAYNLLRKNVGISQPLAREAGFDDLYSIVNPNEYVGVGYEKAIDAISNDKELQKIILDAIKGGKV